MLTVLLSDRYVGITDFGYPSGIQPQPVDCMKSESNCPEWLSRARALWPSGGAPGGLDRNWSPKWIKRFLVYLEKRNRGVLPQELPGYGVVDSFERFLRQSWKLEDWQVEQARRAVDWLIDATGSHRAEPAAGEMPVRERVELESMELAAWGDLEEYFVEEGGMESGVRIVARRKGRALKTEKSYVVWVGRLRRWWGGQSAGSVALASREQAGEELERAISGFLDYIAVVQGVAVATQRQALNALIFAFRACLGMEPGLLPEYRGATRGRALPVVLSKGEMGRFLDCVEPKVSILVKLLYGGGLRLSEALRLRVKDLGFALGCVMVRDGKGSKDRRTTLPAGLVEPLREHLRRVQILFNQDRAEGLDGVFMPNQLDKKYPKASKEWIRHPHGAGTARACFGGDDDDLSACDESSGDACEESAGRLGS